MLVSPRPRGNVTITFVDVSDPAVINPNWLIRPVDQEVAVAVFKRMRTTFVWNGMRLVLEEGVEYYPGEGVENDSQILDFVRDNLGTIYHALTGCRMGRIDDPNVIVCVAWLFLREKRARSLEPKRALLEVAIVRQQINGDRSGEEADSSTNLLLALLTNVAWGWNHAHSSSSLSYLVMPCMSLLL